MNALKVQATLKEKLDEIDNRVANEVRQDLVETLLKIKVGMWEKGKIIAKYRDKISQVGEFVQ